MRRPSVGAALSALWARRWHAIIRTRGPVVKTQSMARKLCCCIFKSVCTSVCECVCVWVPEFAKRQLLNRGHDLVFRRHGLRDMRVDELQRLSKRPGARARRGAPPAKQTPPYSPSIPSGVRGEVEPLLRRYFTRSRIKCSPPSSSTQPVLAHKHTIVCGMIIVHRWRLDVQAT